ncbi:hypothetical protein V8D89_009004 [Ganoderma adspersum]
MPPCRKDAGQASVVRPILDYACFKAALPSESFSSSVSPPVQEPYWYDQNNSSVLQALDISPWARIRRRLRIDDEDDEEYHNGVAVNRDEELYGSRTGRSSLLRVALKGLTVDRSPPESSKISCIRLLHKYQADRIMYRGKTFDGTREVPSALSFALCFESEDPLMWEHERRLRRVTNLKQSRRCYWGWCLTEAACTTSPDERNWQMNLLARRLVIWSMHPYFPVIVPYPSIYPLRRHYSHLVGPLKALSRHSIGRLSLWQPEDYSESAESPMVPGHSPLLPDVLFYGDVIFPMYEGSEDCHMDGPAHDWMRRGRTCLCIS